MRASVGARPRLRRLSRSRGGVAQSEVWNAVHAQAVRMSVDSPTHAASDVHRAYADKVRELEDSFPAQQGQCGVFLGLGRDMCVDVVSQPDAFARLWPKLRAGDDLRLRGSASSAPGSSSRAS